MSNIRLVLLGVLCMKPMHGYEIKHMIEDHMGDWTDIKFGSIYFSLSKLAEEDNIEVVEESRQGNRPSRTIYRITDKGRQEYLRLLRKLFTSDNRTLYSLDIGIFFIKDLPKEEAAKYLDEQISKTAGTIEYLNKHFQQLRDNPNVPKQADLIVNHSLKHTQAEYAWLIEARKQLDELY